MTHRRKLLFGATTLGIVLVAAEGICRLVFAAAPNDRWEYERRHLVAEGLPALENVLTPHPTRFWVLRPNLDNVLVSGAVGDARLSFRLSTDADGHRRMPAVPDARETVLFLGDSCTMGLGVEDDQTIPYQVQKRMSGVRCINAGVPGYTAYQGRVVLDEWPDATFPHRVVATVGFNDDYSWDGWSDPEHARTAAQDRRRLISHFALTRWMAGLLAVAPSGPKEPPGTGRPRLNEAEFDEQIRSVITRCRDRHAELVVVLWPRIWPWKRAVLLRIAETEAIPVVDLLSVFQTGSDSGLFVDSVHAGPAGCVVAAEAIVAALSPRRPGRDAR